MSLNPEAPSAIDCVASVDLGGTEIKYALVTASGKILFKDSMLTNALSSGEQVYRNIKNAIAALIAQAQKIPAQVQAIGVGTPGVVEDGCVIFGADNIADWNGFPLRQKLEADFNKPAYVNNDARLSTIAESTFGAGKEYKNAIMITLGTGIGGGVVMNNKLLDNRCGIGEFGAMLISTNGPQEGNEIAAKAQSWESIASARAMVNRFAELSQQAGVEYAQPMNGRLVFTELAKQNPIAIQAIEENVYWLGLGIANLVTCFDPEVVIIGGGISEAGDTYINKIDQATRSLLLPEQTHRLTLKRALLGNKAGFIGAAHMAFSSTDD